MPTLLSDPMQIGIALRNDHGIDLPFLFDDPSFHMVFDERSPGYCYEQHSWPVEGKLLTIYKANAVTWVDDKPHEILMGRLPYYGPSETIQVAWISDKRLTTVEHTLYSKKLLRPETGQGEKSKAGRRLGFDNWTDFKANHNPNVIKPITITNATK